MKLEMIFIVLITISIQWFFWRERERASPSRRQWRNLWSWNTISWCNWCYNLSCKLRTHDL